MLDIESSALIDLLTNERSQGRPGLKEQLREVVDEHERSGKPVMEIIENFGIFTKKQVYDKYIPLVAIASPILCYILQRNSEAWFNGYQFSYELLIFNALFTFIGLCILIKKDKKNI